MRSQKRRFSTFSKWLCCGGTLPYPAFTSGDGGSCDGACGRYHKRRKSLFKISLSNYQLDFYVDNSWSWLPWNWLDGIGKSVQYGLYCITNFVWTISLYLSNATGYVVQEAYLILLTIWQTVSEKAYRPLQALPRTAFLLRVYVGFLLLIILVVGMYVAYTGLNKRETSKALHAVINFVWCSFCPLRLLPMLPYIKK